MKEKIGIIFVIFFNFSFYLIFGTRWPSLDDFALRIQTKIVDGKIHRRDHSFHVDFFAIDGSKEKDGMVAIKFLLPEGKHVTEIYDWTNNLQWTKIILLGEITDGQAPFQQFCFVTIMGDTDLLSAESVLRLRQKNSMAVRLAEEDRGSETNSFTYQVPLRRLPREWSPIGSKLCGDGIDGIFLTDDAYKDVNIFNETISFIRRVNPSTLSRCGKTEPISSPCECWIQYCLPWYPCGWKYCDENQSTVPMNSTSTTAYRCGVQSCRIRRTLRFQLVNVNQKTPMCDLDANGDVC